MELAIIVGVGVVGAIALVSMVHLLARQGFIGGMLAGSLVKTVGVVSPSSVRMGNAKLKVHQLSKRNHNNIVIELVRPCLGSYESAPVELTRSESQELRRLLERAESEMARAEAA